VPSPDVRRQTSQVAPGSSAASLLKPKSQRSQQPVKAQLFPGAGRMAQLEESYRRKFENDIAEGDTRFLNSDDIQFGSFLRRFEGAVYGVWRYPQEAAMRGIEGITPVRITFNRRGEITNIQQLESSGAKILDEEVLRTLRAIGPVGGFPKGYDKDEFHLIAFFQYGGAKRALR
jgi:protein TonB